MVRRKRQVMKCRVCYKEWRKLCMTSLLCVRGAQSHGLNQLQRKALWFPLLEAMMSPQKLLKGADTKHTSGGPYVWERKAG
ncbi:vacuolar protein sorting-associated protein 8 homolog [Carassius carassius]|uniref:vacuolar protein sorting-associated protein 8 homolog n=1 Tax=Carassius carassius TaxID=217509 RepID=UPI002868B440|nr:vacuolar protein sorting-associated protein 8 homolog [Carassius carassius]